MKMILEIGAHHGDDVIYERLEKFPATIGRGYGNDIILHDVYTNEKHIRIDSAGDGWVVEDLGSENGLLVNGTAAKKSPLKSGDVIVIGQTRISVFAPNHPVPATVALASAHPVVLWTERSINVWACFILAVAITMAWAFFEVWTEEPGQTLAATAAGTVGIVAIWAAAWSVAGRLARHKANFKSHAALMSLYLTAGTCTWYVEVYLDFLTNENWFSQLSAYAMNFILLSLLLYGSLTLVSRMSQRRQKLAALFVAGGLVGGVYLFGLVSAKTFNQQPVYPSTLEPYLSQLAPADTVESFMRHNAGVFDSDLFEKQAVAKKEKD